MALDIHQEAALRRALEFYAQPKIRRDDGELARATIQQVWDLEKTPVSDQTYQVTSLFRLSDRVYIDACPAMEATVVGFAFYGFALQVKCSWFSNGKLRQEWIDEFRLTRVEQEG